MVRYEASLPEHRRLRVRRAALACALASGVAHAGAPFQTDDPGVVAAGRTEILVFHQSTLAGDARGGTLAGLEAHVGVVERLEIDVTAPLAFVRSSTSGASRGYGDTTLGVKYRLLDESDVAPAVSAVPKLVIATGRAGRGLGVGGEQVLLALSAQKSLADVQSYAAAGYWINRGPGGRNYAVFGWQVQRSVSERWTFGVEAFAVTAQANGQSTSTGFNIGGYYAIDERNQLLFSAGRGLRNVEQGNRASVYLGYQASF
jgi:hypothetical protein